MLKRLNDETTGNAKCIVHGDQVFHAAVFHLQFALGVKRKPRLRSKEMEVRVPTTTGHAEFGLASVSVRWGRFDVFQFEFLELRQ